MGVSSPANTHAINKTFSKGKIMKLNEIMVFRPNDNGETRLKTLLVDDTVLSRLTRIRGCLYQDHPRLKLVKDLPKPEPEVTMTPEMRKLAEESWLTHCMTKQATPIQIVNPELKTLSFEGQLEAEWKNSPALRKEFTSLVSYTAYCRAFKAGKVKFHGALQSK